jgi:hypothetical protein
MSATNPRESSLQESDDADEPELCVDAADLYDAIDGSSAICPFCFRWRCSRWKAAAGAIEVEGMTPDIDPDDVAECDVVYPPRVPRPAADYLDGGFREDDPPLEQHRACQPKKVACECCDIDGTPLKTRSKDRALAFVEPLARRVGELGYLYSRPTLYDRVEWGKSNPAIQGNDDLVFQVAVAAAVVDARGGDVEAIVTEVLDD